MKQYQIDRAIRSAEIYLQEKKTIRDVAEEIRVSKSTVHLDLIKILPEVDPHLAARAQEKMQHMKHNKHILGGIATKRKYEQMKEIQSV